MGYQVKMAENGRLVLPKKLREEMGLGPGPHNLTIEMRDGEVVIVSAMEKLRRWRRILAPYLENVSVDDFIAERRKAAAQEMAELEEWSEQAPKS